MQIMRVVPHNKVEALQLSISAGRETNNLTNIITQMQTKKWLPEDKEAGSSMRNVPFYVLLMRYALSPDLNSANHDWCVLTHASDTGHTEAPNGNTMTHFLLFLHGFF